jgi:hypothetical protein
LYCLKTEKSRVGGRFISYSKYSRRETLSIQKKVGSVLMEADFPFTLKAGIFKKKSLLSLKSVFDFFHYTRSVEDKAR